MSMIYNRFVNELKKMPLNNASGSSEGSGDAGVQDSGQQKKDQ